MITEKCQRAFAAFLRQDLKRCARAVRSDRYLELCVDGSYRTFLLSDVGSPAFRHTEPGSLIVKVPEGPTEETMRAAFAQTVAEWSRYRVPVWHVHIRDGGFGMGVSVSHPQLSLRGAVGRSWDNGKGGERTEEYESFSRAVTSWWETTGMSYRHLAREYKHL